MSILDTLMLGQDSSQAAIVEQITKGLVPYIATLDRSVKKVDYKALKSAKVAGVVIEAGFLYTSQHTVVANYRNPNLESMVNAAVSANMPYGLYAITRAKYQSEAKKEIEELSYCIRKFPPQLGMWIVPELTSTVSINNKIIDAYYNSFLNLGLKGQMGLYCTSAQLKKFSYKNIAKNWALWKVGHLDSASKFDDLATPEMFSV